jgi:hypothetical protein
MSARFVIQPRVAIAALVLSIAACGDPVASPPSSHPSLSAVKFWEAGSSVAWNRTARELMPVHGLVGAQLNPATEGRVMTYLSIAQYNAVVTAEAAKSRGDRASPAAAAAGASLAVLKSFLRPSAHPVLEARLQAQLAATPWPGEQRTDADAGLAIGHDVGAAVAAYAATDGAFTQAPPPNPGQPGTHWTGSNPFTGLYGARTLVLETADQFRPPPPPDVTSAEFAAALAEVRTLAEGRTNPEKVAVIDYWAPKGFAYMNGLAVDLIVAQRRSEREAARILALTNVAGFDGINACFDAKFAYYLIRPTQVDPTIRLGTGLPNHPAYPSGHSCITSAMATVLGSAFPSERARFEAMIEEAGMSRIWAGLHYRFDCEAGQELGRQVARYVLEHGVNGHHAIPLN